MKQILKYNPLLPQLLSGEKVDTGARFDVSFLTDRPVAPRVETLLKLTKEKRVIHVGCADHIEVIDQKIANGSHLHSLLIDNCSECAGIDTNEEAIEHLRAKGMQNLYCGDDKPKGFWDYILLGEILEHVGNPVAFLQEVNESFHRKVENIIITVPNAYSHSHVQTYLSEGIEAINSDHRFWFTPYTILKVMHEAGIEIVDLMAADQVSPLLHGSTTLVTVGKLSG